MTSTAPWLSRQRKTDLSDMADAAGMTNFKNLLKSDLEDELDKFLRANQTSLSSNPKLADFYKRLKDGSPAAAGKELVKSESKTPSKARRRTIVPKDDVTSDSEANPAANNGGSAGTANPRTPARQSLGVAARVPLPPSPAQIAEDAERHLQSASKWVKQRYQRTGIQAHVEAARDRASTSYSITTFTVALEAFVIFSNLLPLKSLGFATPAVPALGLNEVYVYGPNFWQLLELSFWSTTLLWSSVSVLLPGLAAYFFNLTLKARKQPVAAGTRSSALISAASKFDPFTFNLAKGLIVWLVFVQHVSLPARALRYSREAIQYEFLGGHLWMLVSAGVGTLVSLYEAVLRQ